jgi:hypothetical protein
MKILKSEIKIRRLVGDEIKMLAITWIIHYQSDDRIQETKEMLAITSQEFSTCSNTWGG